MDIALRSRTPKVLSYFPSIFASAVIYHRALKLVPRKTVKSALFPLKTGAEAHTELQQGKTNMHKSLPVKKYTIEEYFHTILQKTFRNEEWYLCRLFSQRPDQPETVGFDRRQRQCFALVLLLKSCL